MLINADFSLPVVVGADEYVWVPSPQPGVERVMLDRVGGEKARATSIVRYARGSNFPAHAHPGGEEILVLSGTFSEDGHDYPAGWYLRSPPGSSHRPSSAEGAVIFVKLWQMEADDQQRVRIDTRDPTRWRHESSRAACEMFSRRTEKVCLLQLEPDARMLEDTVDGAEALVLEGALIVSDRVYGAGSWMRLPAGVYPDIVAGASGARLYLKTGALGRSSLNPDA
jgi:quercetin dioxygenase-like cupin family protein